MESPKLSIPNPTKKKIAEALEGIENASKLDSKLEAERLGISEQEFNERPTEIPIDQKNTQHIDHFHEESLSLNMGDFLNKWEKEHLTKSEETLPKEIIITNKTTYHISHFFISSIIKKVIKETRTNYYYKKYNPVIYGFDEISEITIANSKNSKKLHFEIYLNKRNMIFRKQKYLVLFDVDSEGNIILS